VDGAVHAGKLDAFRRIATRVAAGKAQFADARDPLWGGLTVDVWFDLFAATHCPNGQGGFVRVEWPEPGGLADQPTVVVRAFSLVQSAIIAEMERSLSGRQQRH
jgi:hypothetical protein